MLLYGSASSESKVQELKARIEALPGTPRKAYGARCDLSSPDCGETIVAALNEWLGAEAKIDILVNNAGTELVKRLADIEADDWQKVYDVNVRAPILLTKALIPRFNPSSRIINIGSVGARAGMPGLGLYCSSKAALEGLTRCWAAELGGDGTTVNQVNPGPVQSEMLDNIPKEIVDMQKANTPIQNRLGTPKEVATVVAWLASEKSAWMTGQTLSASGGWAMY